MQGLRDILDWRERLAVTTGVDENTGFIINPWVVVVEEFGELAIQVEYFR